jgi:membrane protein
LVSIYGLVTEPEAVRSQIEALNGWLPEGAARFLAGQMQGVAAASKLRLGAGVSGAFLIALWSARSAMAAIIAAINIAYRVQEERTFFQLQTITLMLTAGAVLFGAAVFAVAVLLPTMVDNLLPVGWAVKTTISLVRWPLLAILMGLVLAALYRFAPSRERRKWRWVSGGAVTAVILWVLGSGGFFYYVTNFSAENETFGALSAVLVMQTWLYITALAVLLGAKLNAETEAEHQTHHARNEAGKCGD